MLSLLFRFTSLSFFFFLPFSSLFFFPPFSSPLLSLSFHLWWTSLVQQTSAHPATHSLSRQEAEERMKNSGKDREIAYQLPADAKQIWLQLNLLHIKIDLGSEKQRLKIKWREKANKEQRGHPCRYPLPKPSNGHLFFPSFLIFVSFSFFFFSPFLPLSLLSSPLFSLSLSFFYLPLLFPFLLFSPAFLSLSFYSIINLQNSYTFYSRNIQ